MITKRDQRVIDFLHEFKVATTSTIEYFFYPSKRVAQRRLKILTDEKHIKRSVSYVNEDYLYYIKKPRFIRHDMLITEFYHYFSKYFDVKRYQVQKQINNIIPDATIGYLDHRGFKKVAFLEVELSHKGFDYDKYIHFYNSWEYKRYFDFMPNVFIVSQQAIKHDKNINFIQIKDIKTDLQAISRQERVMAI